MGACTSKPKTREMESSSEPTKKTRAMEVDAIKETGENPLPENPKNVSLLQEEESVNASVDVPQQHSITEKEELEEANDATQGEMDPEGNLHEESGGGGGDVDGEGNTGKADSPIVGSEDQAIACSDVPQKDLNSSSVHPGSLMISDVGSLDPIDGVSKGANTAREMSDDPPAEATDVTSLGAVLVAGCMASETDDVAQSAEPTDAPEGGASQAMDVDDVPSVDVGAVSKDASMGTEAGELPSAVTIYVSVASKGNLATPETTSETIGTVKEMKAVIPTSLDASRPEENSSPVEAMEDSQGKFDAPGESSGGTVGPIPGPSVEEPDTPVEPLAENSDGEGTGECIAEPPGDPIVFDARLQEREGKGEVDYTQPQETKAEASTDEAQPQEIKAEAGGDHRQPQESKAEAAADGSYSEVAEQDNDDLIDREPSFKDASDMIDREPSFKDASDMPLEPELSPPQ